MQLTKTLSRQIKPQTILKSLFLKMQISVADALQNLKDDPSALFSKVMDHSSMSVEIYRPIKTDPQTPHLQDEIYVIISGSGEFLNNGERTFFNPGDIIFVAAGIEHRFENFTDDFATWVIFFGPLGGETVKS